jgi:hypothetical protein
MQPTGPELDTLRHAATDMIAEAWDALAAEHVVPCSRYRPYIQVGRDYEGWILMDRPAFMRFSGLLARLYPEWFDAAEGKSPRWFPDNFAFRFAEACVTELTRQEKTGAASGDAVEAVLPELVDYLGSADTRLACARRVSHLMTADRAELTVAGVTILAHRQGGESRQIAEAIPTAHSAFNGERPRSFARPEATVVSYATGSDPFTLAVKAARPIDRFLLALHLLYGTTASGIYQVTGETTPVGLHSARMDVLPHTEFPLTVRPAMVSQATVQPIEKLLALYDSTEHRRPKELVHGLEIAISKFTDSFSPRSWSEKIVDLATALEAALSGRDKTDVTLRICTRAAHLLSTDGDRPQVIYADVKALYDMRSSLVHGSVIMEKELNKWLAVISTASQGSSLRMRIELAVDRLRDLVRRSILLRLLLNSIDRWPLRGDPPPLDQILADADAAQELRNTWHQGAADLGAPEAARPAITLCNSIHDDYPGKHG